MPLSICGPHHWAEEEDSGDPDENPGLTWQWPLSGLSATAFHARALITNPILADA